MLNIAEFRIRRAGGRRASCSGQSLIERAKHGQFTAKISHVSDLKQSIFAQFALDIQRVLDDVWRAPVVIVSGNKRSINQHVGRIGSPEWVVPGQIWEIRIGE